MLSMLRIKFSLQNYLVSCHHILIKTDWSEDLTCVLVIILCKPPTILPPWLYQKRDEYFFSPTFTTYTSFTFVARDAVVQGKIKET